MKPHNVCARIDPPRARRVVRGASLIELLVALLVLSLGLVGMAALQTRVLKGNISSLQRSQAVMLSHYALDSMRIDRDAVRRGDYNTGSSFACGAGAFSGTTLAQNTLRQWITAVKRHIGHSADATSCVHVICNVDRVCTINIRWDDSKAGGLGEQTLTTTSRL
jgi:type IV pilus assembly protein PilV